MSREKQFIKQNSVCPNRFHMLGLLEHSFRASGLRLPRRVPMSGSVGGPPENSVATYTEEFKCEFCSYGETRDETGRVLERINPRPLPTT